MSYEVQLEDLRSSAKASRSAAKQAVAADPDGALSQLAAGMPGSTSAGLVASVASGWQTTVTSWAKRARGYGDDLDDSAAAYEASDAAAQRDFGGGSARPGGR